MVILVFTCPSFLAGFLMKVLTPIFVSILLLPLLANSALALGNDTLKTAADQNFQTETNNFQPNQKIFVRLETLNPGGKERILRVLDSQYQKVSQLTLIKSGPGPFSYSVSLNAPDEEGYYSLEATIKDNLKITKSVKTIKVGSPSNADIKVQIKSNVSGEKITGEVEGESQSTNDNQGNNELFSDYQFGDQKDNQSFLAEFKIFLSKVANFFWPF